MTRHSVPDSAVRLPSTSPSSVVPCYLYGCTHRSSTRDIPRFSPRRVTWTYFFCVCTHRCENNHPSHCFLSFSEVVLGDARPTTLFADASQLVVVREPFESLLHIVSFCPRPDHSVSTLCLPYRTDSLGQRTFCRRQSLPFPLVLKPFLCFCLDSPSLTRVAKTTFLTHFPTSILNPDLKSSWTSPSLTSCFSYSVSSIYRIMIMTITVWHSSRWCWDRLWESPSLLSFLLSCLGPTVGFTGIPFPHWLISTCTHVCHGFPRKKQFLGLTLRINWLTTPVDFVWWVTLVFLETVLRQSCLLCVSEMIVSHHHLSRYLHIWYQTRCTQGTSISGRTLSKMWSSHQNLYPQNPYPSVVCIVGTGVPGGFFVQGFHRPSDMEIR